MKTKLVGVTVLGLLTAAPATAARKPSNTDSGVPPGLLSFCTITGGTASISTALATRPGSARAT